MVEKLEKADDWRLCTLLAALVIKDPLVRHQELDRSKPTKSSQWAVWCHAYRGKGEREGVRPEFGWRMVRHGLSGLDMGGKLVEKWQLASTRAGHDLDYLAFNHRNGTEVSCGLMNDVPKELATVFLADTQAAIMKAYCFRRGRPAECMLYKTPATVRCEMGGSD